MNNETAALNRNRSVSPLADLESDSLSTVGSNRSSTANSTLHFTLDHLLNQMYD
jgi:hypothetical protein